MNKYTTFALGQFNDPRYYEGLIKKLTAMENKITKPIKSVCKKATFVVDDELGKLTYYWRFVTECPNAQTDVPERLLKIEVAEDENGNAVKLNDWQMQTACETILNQHAKTW